MNKDNHVEINIVVDGKCVSNTLIEIGHSAGQRFDVPFLVDEEQAIDSWEFKMHMVTLPRRQPA